MRAKKNAATATAMTTIAASHSNNGGVRVEPTLAQRNVQIGARSILAERVRVAKELPAVDLDHVARMPSVALALVEIDMTIRSTAKDESDLVAKLAVARRLREKLLVSADALVVAGIFSAGKVAAIRKGSGAFDAMGDLVALSSLYLANTTKLHGKCAVTAAEIAEAAALGKELLARLTPGRAKKEAPVASAAVAKRAALTEQILARHELMRRIGMWLFGEAGVDKRVPRLQARKTAKQPRPAKVPPPPASGVLPAAE